MFEDLKTQIATIATQAQTYVDRLPNEQQEIDARDRELVSAWSQQPEYSRQTLAELRAKAEATVRKQWHGELEHQAEQLRTAKAAIEAALTAAATDARRITVPEPALTNSEWAAMTS